MTRFARASGSKASNERAPADATPWAVMKEQLARAKQDAEEAKKRDEAEKKRLENYENFLNEQKTMKRKVESWCDFPEETRKQTHNNSSLVAHEAKKKKKNHKQDDAQVNKHNSIEEAAAMEHPKKQKSKKNNIRPVEKEVDDNQTEASPPNDLSFIEKGDIEKPDDLQSKKVNKKKNNYANKQNAGNTSLAGNEASQESIPGKLNNKANKELKRQNRNVDEAAKEGLFENSVVPKAGLTEAKYQSPNQQKRIKSKFESGKPIRRKVEDDRAFQLIINGREVELVRYDGFPVMKRDAERLYELQKSMISKGIPKSEVQRTMKLERRRAEKALARLKRDVCYNCRKGGHNLSDCPELKSKIPEQGGGADGVCFKCGSTEHRQFECKVQRNQEFRFASCFICKEQGHIARQCPDNAKGLYPNGGACKLCGDVTHLRKDCPTTKTEKEEMSVRLETLASAVDIEGIALTGKTTATDHSVKKPKKVKF